VKLDEIVLIAHQNENQLKSYINHIYDEKEIGKSEGFTIFLGTIDGMEAFVSRAEDGSFIGYVIGGYVSLLNKKYFRPKYTYFDIGFRGKGYASATYIFIVKKMDTPIISDGEQTKFGRDLWKSLKNKIPCKVYDSENGKIIELGDVGENDLYSTDTKIGERYHLVLEQLIGLKRGCPPSKIFFENTVYTDPIREYL
jgi:hypothetical protein